jgi:hypothetical protein
MDLSKLSDYQLYEIIQNSRLDSHLRKLANDEFNNRRLTVDQIQGIISKHDALFVPEKEESLQLKYKILITLFPFFIPIRFITKWLARGQKRKWKDYWFYISVGYLLWTIVAILLGRYFYFAQFKE